jgi:hypothetical protein
MTNGERFLRLKPQNGEKVQKRYHLNYYDDFHKAVKEKHKLEEKNPDIRYQIRKKAGGTKFDLVVRVPANQVMNNPEGAVKTRRKR